MTLKSLLARFFAPWSVSHVIFEVTARCNQRCPHCYNVWSGGEFKSGELPPERALELVDRIVDASGCRHFTFTGGEPTLRADLEDLVRRARARCDSVTLITNGTLLDEDRVRSLIDAGVGMFELPLNSADRAVHNSMAGGFDSFDRVTKAAADVRYNGSELAFVFVGTARNIEGWRDALELGIALGARAFLFNRYNAGGASRRDPGSLLPSIAQVRDALSVAQEYSSKYGVGIGASIAIPPCLIDPKPYPDVGFGFCGAGTDRAYYTVGPTGDVRPCNHTLTVLGNVFEKPISAMAKCRAMRDFMAARPAFCSGCAIENECLGGCKAAAEVCFGSLSNCEPFLAANIDEARKIPK